MGVADGGRVIAERRADATRSHVGHLPGLVDATLAAAGLDLAALEGVAVSAGPGSFTGLRIGAAFAKGLAYASALPLVGVPTLEAHAACVDVAAGTLVCVANDARKGEVFAALFEVRGAGGVERRWPDRAWRPDELLAALPSEAILVGDARAVFPERPASGGGANRWVASTPRGGVVARLGEAALARGEHASVGDFEPTYVRAPDAALPSRPLR